MMEKNKIIFYFYAFLLIYATGAVEVVFLDSSLIGTFCKAFMLLIPLIIVYFYLNKMIVYKKIFICMFSFMLFFAVNLTSSQENFSSFIMYFLKFVLFFVSCLYFRKKNIDFQEYLYKVIVFIAKYSIYIYIPFILLRIPFPYLTFQIPDSDSFYENYLYLYYYRPFNDALVNIGPLRIGRNAAFFWEPGLYGVFLSYALYYHIFKNVKNKKNFLYLIINILSTFSTTALAIACLFIGIKILKKMSYRERLYCIIPTMLIVVLGVTYILKGKASVQNAQGGMNSFSVRLLDLTIGFLVFQKHPLYGTGFQNTEEFRFAQKLNRGSSNGLITWMFTMGTVGIIFLLLPFLINIKKSTDKFNILIYLGLFLILNMTEPIITSPFMTFLLAQEYSKTMKRIQYEQHSVNMSEVLWV